MATQVELRLTIRLWAEDGRSLPADIDKEAMAQHVERCASLIEEGYHSGQIIDDRAAGGWWQSELVGSTPRRKQRA